MATSRSRVRVSRRAALHAAALGIGGALFACSSDSGPRTASSDILPATPLPTGPVRTSTATDPRAPSPTPETVTGTPVCLVTKQQGVSAGYVPPDLVTLPVRLSASTGVQLRREAADALIKLVDAAAGDGQKLFALSGFRSFAEQERILRDETASYGRAVAERQVAPPGHSEHQLGVAADITGARTPYDLRAAWGDEPDGRWLAANAPRFGFVISYPRDAEGITGYTYEPWHIRHVGMPLAEKVAASGLTLTEFLPKFNLTAPCP